MSEMKRKEIRSDSIVISIIFCNIFDAFMDISLGDLFEKIR